MHVLFIDNKYIIYCSHYLNERNFLNSNMPRSTAYTRKRNKSAKANKLRWKKLKEWQARIEGNVGAEVHDETDPLNIYEVKSETRLLEENVSAEVHLETDDATSSAPKKQLRTYENIRVRKLVEMK